MLEEICLPWKKEVEMGLDGDLKKNSLEKLKYCSEELLFEKML